MAKPFKEESNHKKWLNNIQALASRKQQEQQQEILDAHFRKQ